MLYSTPNKKPQAENARKHENCLRHDWFNYSGQYDERTHSYERNCQQPDCGPHGVWFSRAFAANHVKHWNPLEQFYPFDIFLNSHPSASAVDELVGGVRGYIMTEWKGAKVPAVFHPKQSKWHVSFGVRLIARPSEYRRSVAPPAEGTTSRKRGRKEKTKTTWEALIKLISASMQYNNKAFEVDLPPQRRDFPGWANYVLRTENGFAVDEVRPLWYGYRWGWGWRVPPRQGYRYQKRGKNIMSWQKGLQLTEKQAIALDRKAKKCGLRDGQELLAKVAGCSSSKLSKFDRVKMQGLVDDAFAWEPDDGEPNG